MTEDLPQKSTGSWENHPLLILNQLLYVMLLEVKFQQWFWCQERLLIDVKRAEIKNIAPSPPSPPLMYV